MSSLARSNTPRLTGVVRRVGELASAERRAMLALLVDHFQNVAPGRFADDLAEKESVIMVSDDASGDLCGFSTLMRLRVDVAGTTVTAFFSGDTIVHRDYWGEALLSRLWARHVFQLAARESGPVYWFLISSGYRTYRFLPVFFRTFYPTFAAPTPAWTKLALDTLGDCKFPGEYDAAAGVVRPRHPVPLKPELAAISERRRADPHVAFFITANPGHARGDELACLTELVPDNLTLAGRRMLGGSDAAQ